MSEGFIHRRNRGKSDPLSEHAASPTIITPSGDRTKATSVVRGGGTRRQRAAPAPRRSMRQGARSSSGRGRARRVTKAHAELVGVFPQVVQESGRVTLLRGPEGGGKSGGLFPTRRK